MNCESTRPDGAQTTMTAFCGLDCDQCGAYIATRDNDDHRRRETAKEWSEMFNVEIDPKTINCKGCTSDGPLFSHCNVCKVRKCAQDAGLENCASCDDYPCGKLEGILKFAPEARENLERLRS